MRALARLFAALTLLVLIGASWLMLAPRPDIAPPDRPPPQPSVLTGPVDRILIEKSARRLTVFRDQIPLRTYRVALGFSPDGDKARQGDGRTPEGVFRIDRRNDASAYHLSLGIDYPRPQDRARAAAQRVDPGGDIFIHGQPNQRPDGDILAGDWTAGCIALTDAEIRELFAATALGTRVEIRP
ncbi:L,D-transpeptidase family protein [Paracoccus salsus]|uniref:L,D-transpeptidase family protein n=1 Tax=Paracoccus salsus TaxID=2911061 RepID=UPI001F022FDA|nr:L,D-transpeptidase family protein [Paracoccus salsus]MCF3973004.1 L,D-transpeptidase family protein [Paracoccus salsus]